MAIAIRDVREHDLDSVLALNNGAGPTILPLDAAKLRFFFERADYFRVAVANDHLAGFLIALKSDAPYENENYRWFRRQYPHFVYIDRIVVARPYRGHGLGRIFYCDVESYSEVRVPLLACEVDLEPRDDVSVLFHGTYGFKEIGQQVLADGRRVSMLAKPLPSFGFVRETYLKNADNALPNLPWMSERVRPALAPALASGAN